MPRKRFTMEQIIHEPREAEVELAKGRTIAEVCKFIDVTDQIYYRWCKEIWRPQDGPSQAPEGAGVRERLAVISMSTEAEKFLREQMAFLKGGWGSVGGISPAITPRPASG